MDSKLLRLNDMEDLGMSDDYDRFELTSFGCSVDQALAISDYAIVGCLYCDEQLDGTKRFFIVDPGHASESYEGDDAEAVEILTTGTIADIVLDTRW